MRGTIILIYPLPLTTTQIVLITVHITSEINQIIQQWIKRTELEIQRDKYEAVIEERDALIHSLRGENEKLKRDLESERGFYREKVPNVMI